MGGPRKLTDGSGADEASVFPVGYKGDGLEDVEQAEPTLAMRCRSAVSMGQIGDQEWITQLSIL
eukprot:3437376-Pyramimonas_sp.AAC.1